MNRNASVSGRYFLLLVWLSAMLWIACVRTGQAGNQDRHQQQQQQEREQQFTPKAPDVRLLAPGTDKELLFPDEAPCRFIERITLEGLKDLPHGLRLQKLAEQARGHCLGTQGINQLMSALQNRLTDQGWVTTRILAPSQDLAQGHLRLRVLPGRVEQVRLTEDSDGYASLSTAIPSHAGGLLNLRDIEQGLENLQRLPTTRAKVELVAGREPGGSEVIIHRTQSRFWRLGSWLDDGGTRATGRYQSGLMLALDNPLSLSDSFYLTAGRDLGFSGGKHIKTFSGHYSLPFGYWLLSIDGGNYDYLQTSVSRTKGTQWQNGVGKPVTVTRQNRYQGESGRLSAQLKRVIHRNGSQKTALSYTVMTRTSGNRRNNIKLEPQHRHTSAWRMAATHRHYLGKATLDSDVSYQQGTRWFGAVPAAEEGRGEGTALSKITRWSTRLNLPFQAAGEHFRYIGHYRHQVGHNRLTPPDQFSIGNRWTVRGFDGETTLNANDGWLLRNELAWRTPLPQQELYLGMDYGEVSGPGIEAQPGTRLAGGLAGLRGAVASTGVDYDVFAGVPLSKPDGMRTDPVALGFRLNWQH